jgi:hypothetical protein
MPISLGIGFAVTKIQAAIAAVSSGFRLRQTDNSLVLRTNGTDHLLFTDTPVTHLASILLTDGVSFLLTID